MVLYVLWPDRRGARVRRPRRRARRLTDPAPEPRRPPREPHARPGAACGVVLAAAVLGRLRQRRRAARQGARDVEVKLTDAGCDAREARAPGRARSRSSQNGGTLDGDGGRADRRADRSSARRRTSPPGSTVVHAHAAGRAYTLVCPNGDQKRQGRARRHAARPRGVRPPTSASSRPRPRGYARYVEGQSTSSSAADAGVRRRGEAGNLAAGEGALRPGPRPVRGDRAGRRELRRPRPRDRRPDQRRDEPAGAGPASTGSSRALWQKNTTAGMAPYATKLLADVTTLDAKVDDRDLPARAARQRRRELLNEVAKSKITGEEERYSHTDLVDFEANVDGAQAGVRPPRPALPRTGDGASSTIDAALRRRRGRARAATAGDGYGSLYTRLTQADTGSSPRRSTRWPSRSRRSRAPSSRRDAVPDAPGQPAAPPARRGGACAALAAAPPARATPSAERRWRRRRGGRRPSRSTARTRPGSPRRRRTGCIFAAFDCHDRRRAPSSRPAAGLDRRGRAMTAGQPLSDARPTRRSRRRTTPARRSACRPRG